MWRKTGSFSCIVCSCSATGLLLNTFSVIRASLCLGPSSSYHVVCAFAPSTSFRSTSTRLGDFTRLVYWTCYERLQLNYSSSCPCHGSSMPPDVWRRFQSTGHGNRRTIHGDCRQCCTLRLPGWRCMPGSRPRQVWVAEPLAVSTQSSLRYYHYFVSCAIWPA